MIAKLATAVPIGAGMTLSLLFAMQALITMQSGEVVARTPSPLIKFIRDIPDEELIREEFPMPERVEPLETPDPPDARDNPDGLGFTPVHHGPLVPPGPHESFGNPFMSHGPLTKIVIVQPAYPIAAAQKGIEGYVIVQFDVLPDGTVGDVVVIESSNSVFNRAAIQAAQRFRYKARIVDGVPQSTSGVQYKFRFEMNQ